MTTVPVGTVLVLREPLKAHRLDDPTFCTFLGPGLSVLVLAVPRCLEPLGEQGRTVVLCGRTLWRARLGAVMSRLEEARA